MSATIIRNGRVIDPANKREEVFDLAIVDGKIAKSAPKDADVIDAKGLIIAPGLIDIHVHLREPGFSHKEMIASGARIARSGRLTPSHGVAYISSRVQSLGPTITLLAWIMTPWAWTSTSSAEPVR